MTVVPLHIPKLGTLSSQVNIPLGNPNLRSKSANIPTIKKSLTDTTKIESVYLTEIVNSVNINEINITHITDCAIKKN